VNQDSNSLKQLWQRWSVIEPLFRNCLKAEQELATFNTYFDFY